MRGKSHKKERSPTITIGLYPDLPREKMVRLGNHLLFVSMEVNIQGFMLKRASQSK